MFEMLKLGKILALGLCLFVGAAFAQNPPAPVVAPPAPSTSFGILARSGVAASVTGTVGETVLAAIPIPAIGVNGQLKINTFWTMPNSANSKTVRVRLGGLGGTQISSNGSSAFTTISQAHAYTHLIAANSLSAQNTFFETPRGTDGIITSFGVMTTGVDMTQSQSLVLTGQLSNSGETLTLVGYTVELAN